MDPTFVFDRVLASLGFTRQLDLAVALGRKPSAVWYWRKFGFPKSVRWDLLQLSGKLDKPLPPEFWGEMDEDLLAMQRDEIP